METKGGQCLPVIGEDPAGDPKSNLSTENKELPHGVQHSLNQNGAYEDIPTPGVVDAEESSTAIGGSSYLEMKVSTTNDGHTNDTNAFEGHSSEYVGDDPEQIVPKNELDSRKSSLTPISDQSPDPVAAQPLAEGVDVVGKVAEASAPSSADDGVQNTQLHEEGTISPSIEGEVSEYKRVSAEASPEEITGVDDNTRTSAEHLPTSDASYELQENLSGKYSQHESKPAEEVDNSISAKEPPTLDNSRELQDNLSGKGSQNADNKPANAVESDTKASTVNSHRKFAGFFKSIKKSVKKLNKMVKIKKSNKCTTINTEENPDGTHNDISNTASKAIAVEGSQTPTSLPSDDSAKSLDQPSASQKTIPLEVASDNNNNRPKVPPSSPPPGIPSVTANNASPDSNLSENDDKLTKGKASFGETSLSEEDNTIAGKISNTGFPPNFNILEGGSYLENTTTITDTVQNVLPCTTTNAGSGKEEGSDSSAPEHITSFQTLCPYPHEGREASVQPEEDAALTMVVPPTATAISEDFGLKNPPGMEVPLTELDLEENEELSPTNPDPENKAEEDSSPKNQSKAYKHRAIGGGISFSKFMESHRFSVFLK